MSLSRCQHFHKLFFVKTVEKHEHVHVPQNASLLPKSINSQFIFQFPFIRSIVMQLILYTNLYLHFYKYNYNT